MSQNYSEIVPKSMDNSTFFKNIQKCFKINRNHFKTPQNVPKRVPETLKKNQKLFENWCKITGKIKISNFLPIQATPAPSWCRFHFIPPNFFSIKTNLRGRPPFIARQISGRAI